MKTVALLLAAALLNAAPSLAQSVAAAPGSAQAVGLRTAALAPAYFTRTVAGGGSITYFGAVCSHDAAHAQFAQLRQAFAASRPTLVLIEKPDVGVDSTEAATVSRYGEAGYARLLAQQHGVRTERLDNPVAEYEYLRGRTTPAELQVYYLLRISRQLRQNNGTSKAQLKQTMQQLLANSATFLPGTAPAMRTPAEFAAAYRQLCPSGGQWWQVALGTRPAPAFVQRLDEEARAFCAQQLSQKVAERTQAGERVLVVLDRSQLPAPAATYAAAPLGR